MSESASTYPLYEGLFLISQSAASDLNAATEHLRQILTRGEAEIIVLRKWDERRLAYPIKGQKRGTYLIAYFHVPPQKLQGIERELNLSEQVLRAMMLRADHVGEVELEAAKRGEKLWDTEQKLRGEEGGKGRGREKPAAEGGSVAEGAGEAATPQADAEAGAEPGEATAAAAPSETATATSAQLGEAATETESAPRQEG